MRHAVGGDRRTVRNERPVIRALGAYRCELQRGLQRNGRAPAEGHVAHVGREVDVRHPRAGLPLRIPEEGLLGAVDVHVESEGGKFTDKGHRGYREVLERYPRMLPKGARKHKKVSLAIRARVSGAIPAAATQIHGARRSGGHAVGGADALGKADTAHLTPSGPFAAGRWPHLCPRGSGGRWPMRPLLGGAEGVQGYEIPYFNPYNMGFGHDPSGARQSLSNRRSVEGTPTIIDSPAPRQVWSG